MKAIRKKPGCAPEIIEVENTLKALQRVHRNRNDRKRCGHYLQRGGTHSRSAG